MNSTKYFFVKNRNNTSFSVDFWVIVKITGRAAFKKYFPSFTDAINLGLKDSKEKDENTGRMHSHLIAILTYQSHTS